MNWADGPMAAFDIESTGVDPETARIVTASVVEINAGQKPVVREWLANPGVDIPAEATAVHGITTEHAREHGQDPAEVARAISGLLADLVEEGKPIVIYNAPYDLTLLDRECRRYDGVHPVRGVPTLHERCEDDGLNLYVVDPLVLDRACEPRRKGAGSRKLTYICQNVYGIPLSDEDAHGSTADALATARVAWKIAHRYPVGKLSLPELQQYQAKAHHEWAVDFESWLRNTKRKDGATAEEIAAVVIERDWPLRPYVEPAVTR